MELRLTIKVPDMSNLTEFDLRMYLGAKLYEEGRLSLGYCAEVAGLSKRAFAELLGKFGVSLFNDNDPDGLRSDIENANKFFQQNNNI
jgi:predicted HTH domain antitoxin